MLVWNVELSGRRGSPVVTQEKGLTVQALQFRLMDTQGREVGRFGLDQGNSQPQ